MLVTVKQILRTIFAAQLKVECSSLKELAAMEGQQKLEAVLQSCPLRSNGFRKAIRYLDDVRPREIIETGTARGWFDLNYFSLNGDGGSTLLSVFGAGKIIANFTPSTFPPRILPTRAIISKLLDY